MRTQQALHRQPTVVLTMLTVRYLVHNRRTGCRFWRCFGEPPLAKEDKVMAHASALPSVNHAGLAGLRSIR